MKVYYSKPKRTNLFINKQLFIKLVAETIDLTGLNVSEKSAIVINFVSEKTICLMNSDYMGHQGITDVISFSYLADEDIDKDSGIFAEIFVCEQKAKLEAEERNLEFSEELILYVVHGILHIAGYDDLDNLNRKKMRLAEAKCMNYLKKHFNLSSVVSLKI